MNIPNYGAILSQNPLSEPEDQFRKEEQHRASIQQSRDQQRSRQEAQRLREFNLRSSAWEKNFDALRDKNAPQSKFDEELAKINSNPKNKSDVDYYMGKDWKVLAGREGEELTTTNTYVLDSPEDIGALVEEGLITPKQAESFSRQTQDGGSVNLTVTKKDGEITGVKSQQENEEVNNYNGMGITKNQFFNLALRISNAEGWTIDQSEDYLLEKFGGEVESDDEVDTKTTKKKPSLKGMMAQFLNKINLQEFSSEEEAEASGVKGDVIINGRPANLN